MAQYRPEVCQACREVNPMISCAGCDMRRPEILPPTYLVFMAVENYGSYLFDGMGGLNAAGADLAARQIGCPIWYQPIFLRNLGIFLTALRKAQEDDGR